MRPNCPGCPETSQKVVRNGTFKRHCDSRHIQRFKCTACGVGFSASTGSTRYRQKCRRINPHLQSLFCKGLSQRALADELNVSRKTIARRIRWLSEQARARQAEHLRRHLEQIGPFNNVQFDELHTFEHTKCKPTVIGVLVEEKTRFILGHYVAQIPANGLLAAISRKKYGYRKDKSGTARNAFFESMSRYVGHAPIIRTDEHKRYPSVIKRHIPEATLLTYKSIRGCITGQGELKKTQFDPLFSVNHTLAMLRYKINRLVRRTWSTTKLNERLDDHVALYIDVHNRTIVDSGVSGIGEYRGEYYGYCRVHNLTSEVSQLALVLRGAVSPQNPRRSLCNMLC